MRNACPFNLLCLPPSPLAALLHHDVIVWSAAPCWCRNPNCICKRCKFPRIYRLSYDVAQYMMEFCDQASRQAVLNVAKRCVTAPFCVLVLVYWVYVLSLSVTPPFHLSPSKASFPHAHLSEKSTTVLRCKWSRRSRQDEVTPESP